ncbi:uncharacterized protein LOC34619535 [Cyclospora cayetanensis]|uniref:Uncharacterized protein LOC34619535 n=1 Tax=Cyclospora cayetanensis TaxID=88456 RepID=A0A6P6RTX7_9EIME|nr:uncharacterized protein LOC34619535 [Cyclospora cayetanensis]
MDIQSLTPAHGAAACSTPVGAVPSPSAIPPSAAPVTAKARFDPVVSFLAEDEERLQEHIVLCDELLKQLMLSSLRHNKKLYIQQQLLPDLQQLQQHAESTTARIEKQLKQAAEAAEAIARPIHELQQQQQVLQQAAERAAAALEDGQLLLASECLHSCLSIRDEFERIDQQQQEQQQQASRGSLCTAEAAVLQRLQQQQHTLLQQLHKRLSASAGSLVAAALQQQTPRQQQEQSRAETEGSTVDSGQHTQQEEQAQQREKHTQELSLELRCYFLVRKGAAAVHRFCRMVTEALADDSANYFKVLLQPQKTVTAKAHAALLQQLFGKFLKVSAVQQVFTLGASLAAKARRLLESLAPPSAALQDASAASAGEASLGKAAKIEAVEAAILVAMASPLPEGGGDVVTSAAAAAATPAAAAAAAFFIATLSQELDVQGVRILNHFLEAKPETFAFKKEGGARDPEALRQVEARLEECVVLSRCCRRSHAALLQQFRNALGSAASPAAAEGSALTSSNSSLPPSSSRGSQNEVLQLLTPQQVLQVEHPALMQRREELVADYIALEHALMLWAVGEALEVQDELPFAAAARSVSENSLGLSLPVSSSEAPAVSQEELLASLRQAEEEAVDGGECFYSTMTEDLFFVFQASVSRALRSGDSLALCALLNHVAAALRCEVLTALRSCLEASKAPYAHYVQDEARLKDYSIINALEARFEGRPLPDKIRACHSWPVSVNNVQLCLSSLAHFKAVTQNAMQQQHQQEQLQQHDAAAAADSTEADGGDAKSPLLIMHYTLQELDGAAEALQQLHSRCCTLTIRFFQVYWQHCFQLLKKCDFDRDAALREEGSLAGSTWRLKLQRLFALLAFHFNRCFDAKGQATLCDMLVDLVVKHLESGLLEKNYTAAGGIFANQETRTLCLVVQRLSLNPASGGSGRSRSRQQQQHLEATANRCSFFDEFEDEEETLESVQINYPEPVRPKFCRLFEIGELLSLPSLREVPELLGEVEGGTSLLSLQEIKTVLRLRVDFENEEIEEVVRLAGRPSFGCLRVAVTEQSFPIAGAARFLPNRSVPCPSLEARAMSTASIAERHLKSKLRNCPSYVVAISKQRALPTAGGGKYRA